MFKETYNDGTHCFARLKCDGCGEDFVRPIGGVPISARNSSSKHFCQHACMKGEHNGKTGKSLLQRRKTKESIKERFAEFIRLYREMRTRRPALDAVGISPYTLKKIENGERGYESERQLLKQADEYLASTFRCCTCGVVDKREGGSIQFRPQPPNRRTSVCRSCDNNTSKQRRNNLLTFAIDKATQVKRRCPESSLTSTDIVRLWESQQGRSYYSGQEMSLGESEIWQCASIDRKVPEQPYSFDNCVICTHRENSMKGNLSDRDFLQMCKEITNNWG